MKLLISITFFIFIIIINGCSTETQQEDIIGKGTPVVQEVEKMKIVTLCGENGCCPEVRIGPEYVEIGEEGNLCRLKPQEWDDLRKKILNNEI